MSPAPVFTSPISLERFARIVSSLFARIPKSSLLFKYLSSISLVKSPLSSTPSSLPTASSGLTIFAIIMIIIAMSTIPIVPFTAI